MIDYENIRYPVVILSSFRSGSTALASHIHSKLKDVLLFQEPDTNPNEFSRFEEAFDTTNKYVVKIHAYRLEKYPKRILDYLIYSNEPYKICIRRKNRIEQSLSLYVAFCRDTWSYQKEHLIEDIVPINYADIEKSIELLEQGVNDLNKVDTAFDTAIWYEDFEFGELNVVKTPKPKNYEELYTAVTFVYNLLNK
jgi:hypothetical protein